MENTNDKLVQYTRRCNNIRLHGLSEVKNKNVLSNIISIFKSKLKLNIGESKIEKCYRIENILPNSKPRPILEFNIYKTKQLLF